LNCEAVSDLIEEKSVDLTTWKWKEFSFL